MTYTMEYFNEAVRVEIDLWPPSLLARYRALTIRMVEHGPNLGMPHTRAMGEGLFEIRVKGKEGIGRAFYCNLYGRHIVILHGFVKKTDQTPKREIALARKRMKEAMYHD